MNKTITQKIEELKDLFRKQGYSLLEHTIPVFKELAKHIKQRNLIDYLEANPIEYTFLYHFSRIAIDSTENLYTQTNYENNITEHSGILSRIILGYKFKNCLRQCAYYHNDPHKKRFKLFTVYYNKRLYLVRTFQYWVVEDISTIAKDHLCLKDQKAVEAILVNAGLIKYSVEEYVEQYKVMIKFSSSNTDR